MKIQKAANVSVRELARRLDVSVATVSRALQAQPTVSQPTRDRVLALAKELGYQPNKRLQRFFKTIRHQSHTICLLAQAWEETLKTRTSGEFYLRIHSAIQEALRAAEFHMVVANPDTDLLPDGNLYAVAEGVADGVISLIPENTAVERLAAHTPVVLFNAGTCFRNLDTVIPDIERCARDQMDYLRELGHRRIACFRPRSPAGRHGMSWQDHRFWREYEEYSRALGWELPGEYLEPIEFDSGAHAGAIHALLDRVLQPGLAPTAILTYDIYAPELIRQLAARGRRVPDDISVVGFDDWTCGESCPVALTTFRQDFAKMAKVAVQLLRERLRDPRQAACVVEVAGTMIERTSAAVAAETGTSGPE